MLCYGANFETWGLQMRRREFVAALGGAAALPVVARAQQAEQMRRVGVLMPFHNDDPDGHAEMAALRRGLAEHGWIEGRTIDVGVQWGDDPIEASAKELVGAKPDVLLSRSTPTTTALNNERGLIPLVFVNIAEPVEQGLVQSLSQPGRNITGFTNFDASVGSKLLQLLKEIDPRVVRVVVIYNPQTTPFARSYVRPMESALASRGVETIAKPVQVEADIEAAMMAAVRPGGGLLAIPDAYTSERHDLVITLARRLRLPAVYGSRAFARSGGLMAYAVDARDLMRRAADYVDRILRGVILEDLPVRMPTKFGLAINLKTAKALGLKLSSILLAIADEVIE
jgi:putative tryptophan/tyrosine transport system substrate-binding protein